MLSLIINNVVIFAGIGGFLALLLVIADYFLANYGDCQIDINGKKKLTVKGGSSLLNSLAENNVFIPSACGGRGTCGLCKVKVKEGGGPLLPTERPYLDADELKNGVRLSCQVKVKEDIIISIPEALFSIRKFKGVVETIIDYTYDTKGLVIKLIEPAKIDFKAGQYIQLESKKYAKSKQVVSRAYSMANCPENNNVVELIIRRVPDGIMTTFVHDYLKKDDELYLTGPYGDFFIRDTDTDMIFVAGGSGMAPFKGIIEDLYKKESKQHIVYFFGARTTEDLFLVDEMKEYEKKMADFTFIPVISQPEKSPDWKGESGYIPPLLDKHIRDPKNTEGYLCGSPALIASTEKKMKELGIENVYYDSFG
ncbi:MAG: 2Fe-2S iron-sulfur cluster binding domain-containing protein [Candidatus Cloacimonetes bacterium]|nr:2Fe-2S iron-sulfur cluster binding domain-containing protein [Candidatus Cloacimonadota bacterium]